MPIVSEEEALRLCMKAIEKWGANSQLAMIEEEAQELALAMHKFFHRVGGREEDLEIRENEVIDELADMEIMLMQAKLMFDEDKIEARKNFKLNRLKERLNND